MSMLVPAGHAPRISVTTPSPNAQLRPDTTTAIPSIGEAIQLNWNKLYQEKRRKLEQVSHGRLARNGNFQTFQVALNLMSNRFQRQGVSKFVDKLAPSLIHLRSFTSAISSGAQAHQVATLLWCGAQAVIECGIRFSDILTQIIETMTDMNYTFPLLDSYIALFPGREELHGPLRDMCLDYLDYCIVAVTHLRRSQMASLLRLFVSSSIKSALTQSQRNLDTDQRRFQNEVELIYKQTQRAHQLEITRRLAMTPSDLTPPSTLTPSTTILTPSSSLTTGRREHVSYPVTNIVDFQNYAFVGRSTILKMVWDTFEEGHAEIDSGPPCVLLHGLAGVGKSQGALQYAFIHKRDYDATFWVRGETDTELSSTYATIAKKVGYPTSGADGSTARAVDDARDWFETTDRSWLLIFDNVEDIQSLVPYWPRVERTSGAIIVTTQKSGFMPIAKTFREFQMPSLTDEEGARLIFNHLQRESHNDHELNLAETINKLVGGLPLAVVTIAGYIKGSAGSLQEFLSEFQKSSNIWTKANPGAVGNYRKTLATVFEMALGELSKPALAFLRILAFLNPDSIPEEMFRRDHTIGELSFLRNGDELIQLVFELRTRQLVKREENASGKRRLSLHRSLQWSLLHAMGLDPTERESAFKQAYTVVRQFLPTDPDVPGTTHASMYPLFEMMVPQVLSLRSHARVSSPPLDQTLEFAILLRDIGTYLNQSGGWQECREAMEAVNSILNSLKYPADGWIRIDVEADLGIGFEWVGISKRHEMMTHYRRSLEVRQKGVDTLPLEDVTQAKEIILWTGWTDLACGYLEQEQFTKAEDILERALIMYNKWCPERDLPYEHSKYYENMAWVRCWQQRYQEALQYVKHGWELCELAAGPTSGWTLLYKFHISHVLFNMGKHSEAIDVSLDVLRARILTFGEYHHFTVDSYYSTGAMHLECGNLEQAEMMMRKCMQSATRSTWSTEHMARGQYVLAQVLKRRENISQEAEALEKQAKAVKDRMITDFPLLMQQVRPEDRTNDMAVYDQMVSIQSGRFTGRLRHGGELPHEWTEG